MSDVLVITGARKGIGRYLAEYYIAQGYQVIGCSRQGLDEPLDGYEHFELDVANEHDVQSMVWNVTKKYGRIDVLINNAGIATMNHFLLTPKTAVEKIFSTNVFGTFLFAREVGKIMVSQKKGRIVNFATVATPLKLEGEAVYAASKAAVNSLTQVLSHELAPHNITVNAVGPTPVPTDLIKNVPKKKMDALLNRQAFKRFGTNEDIANVIDFFIRKESHFITGQTIYLGGVS
ncbi:MAG: SDR family NAD(P)-dependent oxidoreductase [Nitrospirales bacterium]